MNISDLNKLSIKNYLAEMNIHPVKDRRYYGMYRSPFRADDNASLKVDFQKNLWIDFGSNEGGTMIDLVMRMNNSSIQEAIITLEQSYACYNVGTHQCNNVPTDSFSFHGNTIEIQKVQPITNVALVDYLTERKINIDTAKQHCEEIHYRVNDKNYFAIGFRNDSGGYELRNKYFKGCTSKDITTDRSNDSKNDVCLVFEGFMDYLSYLTMKNIQNIKVNTVILNSVSNLSKAIDFIQSHAKIYTYLDNDDAGKRTTHIINNACLAHIDKSTDYAKHKDLNEYLCNTHQAQKVEQVKLERKPSRGFKM